MGLLSNLRSVWDLILSDRDVYLYKIGGDTRLILTALTGRYSTFTYMFWLRLASRRSILRPFAIIKHRHLSMKYNIHIPRTTKIGRGFLIRHGCGVVINPDTVIGDNCTIFQFLSIGASERTPATIDDNVWIGPHVSIVEDVKIGNNVKIGAGTVVINDIPEGCTSVGNPNRIIHKTAK